MAILKSIKESVRILLFLIAGMLVFMSASGKAHASAAGDLAYHANAQTQTGYPQATASYTCNCGDSAWNAVNGIYSFTDNPRDRWTNYGSPNQSDWLAIDFGAAVPFNKVSLYIYNDGGGVQPPSSYIVQYWDGSNWAPVANAAFSPSTPSADRNSVANSSPQTALNTVNFDTVTSDQVRVVLTNGNAYVGLVEFEVYLDNGSTGFTVSFDSNGGTAASSEMVSANSPASEPAAPMKAGYSFGGWYADPALNQAFDFSTPITEDMTLYAKWTQSSNAALSSLTLSSGTLSPVFDPGTTNYAVSVENSVSSLAMTAMAADSTATLQVRVNGGAYATIASGSESGALDLNVGENPIDVQVTAQDGTTKTYSIAIKRAEAPTWTYCANEGGDCFFSGSREVRYGANGSYAYGTFTNVTACNNTIFGDPAPGTYKACYFSDISLSGLTLSSGTLSPGFDAATTSYTVSVANSVSALTVTPAISDMTATVTVNGTEVASGQASASLPLSVGSNTITVVVTALDGTTTKAYAIAVMRAPVAVGLTLSNGRLSPEFDPATTAYSSNVTNDVASVTVTASVYDSTQTLQVRVNGGAYAVLTSGSASGRLDLLAGENIIEVQVISQDGTMTQSYTVAVTRAPSSDANLNSLAVSAGALSPVFSSDVFSYIVAVTKDVYQVPVTLIAPFSSTVTVIDATYGTVSPIAITETEAANGQKSIRFPVTIHDNGIAMIGINVIAQDQVTTNAYSILFRSDFVVASAQTDASGQSVKLTFNQPLARESLTGSAFSISAGGMPVTVTQAVYGTADGNTVYLALSEPLYKWDRITVGIQGGVVQSLYGSPLAYSASIPVHNEITGYSPDFPDPANLHLTNIIAFLNRRHFDVDVNGDGACNLEDIRMLLQQTR